MSRVIPVKVSPSINGCYECTSHKVNKNGYTEIYVCGKSVGLHRLIYEYCYGKIPNKYVVRHKCDNPKCVNPNHLEVGTDLDNVRDRVSRNRSAIGSKNGKAKLNENQALEIWNKRLSEKPAITIGKEYGISKDAVLAIWKRKTWRKITEDA